jgi:hypothetical protein
VAHETAGRGRIACRPGKLAAASLLCRVVSGNAQARHESGHGTGHLRGALIQEAGDEELDDGFPYKCHVSIIELIDMSVLSNRKLKTENWL